MTEPHQARFSNTFARIARVIDMTTQAVTIKISDKLADLSLEQQREVLVFASFLKSQLEGVKGSSLLSFAGSIPAADLTRMQQAIEEGCERIDPDEW